jgi:antitoxin ParD1/3/4
MNVNLTPELERLVNQKVQSGLYNSASEVVREALRLMQEQDELRRIRTVELRNAVKRGFEQSRRGESTPLDIASIKAEGRKRRTAKASRK